MSNYSEDLKSQFKDIKSLRKATVDFIEHGGKIAHKGFYTETSLKRLKRKLRE